MNHPPFDPDLPLTPEIRAHLLQCPSCRAIWEVHRLLQSAPFVSPPQGFKERFVKRLAPQAPRPWPILLLGLLLLLSIVAGALLPPLSLIRLTVGTAQAAAEIASHILLFSRATSLLFKSALLYVPPQLWLSLFASSVGGFALWLLSLRRAQLSWSRNR